MNILNRKIELYMVGKIVQYYKLLIESCFDIVDLNILIIVYMMINESFVFLEFKFKFNLMKYL